MRYLADREQTYSATFRALPEVGEFLESLATHANFRLGLRSETSRGPRKADTGFTLHCLLAALRRRPPEQIDDLLREGAAETLRLQSLAEPETGAPSVGEVHPPAGQGVSGSVLPPRPPKKGKKLRGELERTDLPVPAR